MTRTSAATRERYVAELTEALTTRGVTPARAAEVGREVESHLIDSGASPIDEFGSPAEFAAHIAGKPGPEPSPEPDQDQSSAPESMRFNADAFTEMEILAVVGRDGWEVIDVDEAARFVCRREPAAPRRWQYTRRLAITPGRLDQLHDDGWQDCGRWGVFHYLKRTTEGFDMREERRRNERPATPAKGQRSVTAPLALGIVAMLVVVEELGLTVPVWEKAIGLVVALALASLAVGVYVRR